MPIRGISCRDETFIKGKKMTTAEKSEKVKAEEFSEIAKTIFAPIYPVLADIILKKIPLRKGTCLDLGSGPGHLGIALASKSSFNIISFDLSPFALEHAAENIKEAGLEGRGTTMQGDVHNLPFPDNSIDLIISRGSIFFWHNPGKVFSEAYRVLKPGCFSFIGGGFGTPELKAEIADKMEKKYGGFRESSKKRMSPENIERLKNAMASSGAPLHYIEQDEANIWFAIKKEIV